MAQSNIDKIQISNKNKKPLEVQLINQPLTFILKNVDKKNESDVLDKTLLFIGSSNKGKTTLSCSVLTTLIEIYKNSKKKFWIYIQSSTCDSAKKITNIKNYYNKQKKDEDFVKISECNSIENIIDFYNELESIYLNKKKNFLKKYNFIFYFDDTAHNLMDGTNKKFFTQLISNGRHYKITNIINTQVIKNIPDAIKNQCMLISLIGEISTSNLKILHNYFTLISSIFPNYNTLNDFVIKFNNMYNDRTAMILKESNKNIFTYKVNNKMLDFFNAIEKSDEELLNKKRPLKDDDEESDSEQKNFIKQKKIKFQS